MAENIVSPLLEWLNANPELAGLATFVISASESVAIIGTIIPGSITMTAIGALAGAGVIPLWSTVIFAILGAIVGDGISYWLGYYFKDRINTFWPFRNYPGFLQTGEVFVHKYGVMSVFIGRFVGPVRALVPMVAGMLGMRPLPFIVANVTSAIGWAPAYMLPGILLGAASLELPPDIAIHVMLVLLLMTLFILLCLWLLYKLLRLFHTQIEQMQNAIWQKMKKSPTFSPLTKILKHRDPVKMHGQLTLAFYFLLTGLLFICLAFYVKAVGPANLALNDVMYHFFRGIRYQAVDAVMINLTLLGQKEIILPVIIAIFGFLLINKHWRAAFHALALGILAAGSVYVMKNMVHSPRPFGIFNNAETWSMPSGHTVLATIFFMGLAFLIARSIRPGFQRTLIYTIGVFLSLMVGISRLYLGAHWFTDVLGSWLLASCILILVILSYERQIEAKTNPFAIFLTTLLAMTIAFGFYHYLYISQLKVNYAQINYPAESINMNAWWNENAGLPAYTTSLFGFPSHPINIVWAGDIDSIHEALLKEGWAKPPVRDLVSTLHRIADIQSTQYLSMISPQYLDKRPALILSKPGTNGMKGLMVLRLWDSNRTIGGTDTTLWVGIIALVPRPYSWLYKSHPGEIEIEPQYIFAKAAGFGEWQWKTIDMTFKGKGHKGSQKIMLIRENKIHKKK